MRYFVAVAETLNFTAAAERLHIGQPPLSMQIMDLEDELGVKLFTRTKRKVELTDAGQQFLLRARGILADVHTASQEARKFAQGQQGLIRMGFASSLPYSSIMPRLLFAFRQQAPAVQWQLSEMFTNEQFEALGNNLLDVGLVRYSGGPVPDGLEVKEIGRDPLLLVVNAHHRLAKRRRVAFRELQGEHFITFPTGVGSGLPGILSRLGQSAGFEPQVVQEVKEATTQIGLVAAGLGVALLPAPLAVIQLPGVRYLPVVDAGAYYALSVAHRKADLINQRPLLTLFLNVLASLQ
ncbi:LysR substrate-binding domain-containing protein [Limnobacter humi]|uniref:LysR substrate-binding domain-containing protein n=1 Tax=Limnobacter humi TaxID=1778671 RepID=A0ABT1WC04_9BURK|nr:LysR substrate-binding domain-containing protein [Limnobacter humi]MCQ8895040.1 LysR substrate-binding domain-containing protein [Limnobacter humi]